MEVTILAFRLRRSIAYKTMSPSWFRAMMMAGLQSRWETPLPRVPSMRLKSPWGAQSGQSMAGADSLAIATSRAISLSQEPNLVKEAKYHDNHIQSQRQICLSLYWSNE